MGVRFESMEEALAVFLMHSGHSLETVAPCKAWLEAQKRWRGPEIFHALLRGGTATDCERLVRRFFRETTSRTVDGVTYAIDADADVVVCTTPTVPFAAKIVLALADVKLDPFSNVQVLWAPLVERVNVISCHRLRVCIVPNAECISCLYRCRQLQIVEAPNVKSVLARAFCDCEALTTLHLPQATFVDRDAVVNCANLTTVNLPLCPTLPKFDKCPRLASVVAPNAVGPVPQNARFVLLKLT